VASRIGKISMAAKNKVMITTTWAVSCLDIGGDLSSSSLSAPVVCCASGSPSFPDGDPVGRGVAESYAGGALGLSWLSSLTATALTKDMPSTSFGTLLLGDSSCMVGFGTNNGTVVYRYRAGFGQLKDCGDGNVVEIVDGYCALSPKRTAG
jgi:hypothetical protein